MILDYQCVKRVGGVGHITSWGLKLFEFLGDSILVSPTGVCSWSSTCRGRGECTVWKEKENGGGVLGAQGGVGGVFLWLSFSLRGLFYPQAVVCLEMGRGGGC